MKMKSIGGNVAAIMVSVLVSIPASARAGGIKKRAENQQDRIAQGVKSGQLTARETARIEHKESTLHSEVRDMRQLDGGKLTPQGQRGRQSAAGPSLQGHLQRRSTTRRPRAAAPARSRSARRTSRTGSPRASRAVR